MYSIQKTFTFEAAHRLVDGYEGKCAHVHGHSFVVTLGYKGDDLDAQGMLKDFSIYKPIRKWVDDNLDHATLVNCRDDKLLNWLLSNNQRTYSFTENPTSETLCKFIFDQVVSMGLPISWVEIDETCTSKARYEP